MLAGAEDIEGDLVVQADRRQDEHGVDVVRVQHRPPVVVELRQRVREEVADVDVRRAERIALVRGDRRPRGRTLAAAAEGGGVLDLAGAEGGDPDLGEAAVAQHPQAPEVGRKDARHADDAQAAPVVPYARHVLDLPWVTTGCRSQSKRASPPGPDVGRGLLTNLIRGKDPESGPGDVPAAAATLRGVSQLPREPSGGVPNRFAQVFQAFARRPDRRSGDAQRPGQVPIEIEDRRRDTADPFDPLLVVDCVAPPAGLRQVLRASTSGEVIVVAVFRSMPRARMRVRLGGGQVGQEDLAGRRAVGGAASADVGLERDRLLALDPVDGHDLVSVQAGQMDQFLGAVAEVLQERPGDLAQVEVVRGTPRSG